MKTCTTWIEADPFQQVWKQLLRSWSIKLSWLLPTFAVVLTVVLFVFQARIDLASLSISLVAINTILATLISAFVTAILLFLYLLTTFAIPRLLKRLMVWITLRTVSKAVASQTRTVEATGIGSIDGSVGVSLLLGGQDGVMLGHRFTVFNTATQENWGVLEVSEIQETSCTCVVSDRINPEFWEGLEGRMRSDASPPHGVSIRRQIPIEALFDWLHELLKTWRG